LEFSVHLSLRRLLVANAREYTNLSLPPGDVEVEVVEFVFVIVGYVRGTINNCLNAQLVQQTEVLGSLTVSDVDGAALGRSKKYTF